MNSLCEKKVRRKEREKTHQTRPEPSPHPPPRHNAKAEAHIRSFFSYKSSMLNEFLSVNSTSPTVAPPAHTARRLPVGHLSRAARTHCSHFVFEMVICAPSTVVLRLKRAEPAWPTVVEGFPWQASTEPEMPPQMASSAAFWSWKTMWL